MAVRQVRNWDHNYTYKAPHVEKETVIIRKKSWITKGEKFLYSVISILLLVAATFMVYYSSTTDTLNRELQTLESQVQNQEVKIAGLKYEIKELKRPERIIKKAKENGLNIQSSEVKRASTFQN